MGKRRAPMKGTTRMARRLLPFLQAIADAAGMPTTGLSVSIAGKDGPSMVGGRITMPVLDREDWDLYVWTFVHELQHYLDYIDGSIDTMTCEEAERRARLAEKRVSSEERERLFRQFSRLRS